MFGCAGGGDSERRGLNAGRSELDFCGIQMWEGQWGDAVLCVIFCGVQLPVAPQGDFLYEQKVTKESHRERVFRSPPLPVNPHPQQPKCTSQQIMDTKSKINGHKKMDHWTPEMGA